ncbi:hypothetical protein AMELA_G00177480 [Ameiurus melas]|uniref:Serine/threonine-protein kinase 1 n=1 Tax=Ameiurus melas TaxID=219545 RepID=A0A7J6A9G7_AMEME|nr:hypothetical protein AMELA_G00177480 [Ameiurus melas]
MSGFPEESLGVPVPSFTVERSFTSHRERTRERIRGQESQQYIHHHSRRQAQPSSGGARVVMCQTVRAARHCCRLGVLHHDIKPKNILINTDTLEVKLINFGCGELLTSMIYTKYKDTRAYHPPEWVVYGKYFGLPITVWTLGVLLLELFSGELPFTSDEEIIAGRLIFLPKLSLECCNLICQCLKKVPEHRPTFDKILSHKWFMKELQDNVQVRQSE